MKQLYSNKDLLKKENRLIDGETARIVKTEATRTVSLEHLTIFHDLKGQTILSESLVFYKKTTSETGNFNDLNRKMFSLGKPIYFNNNNLFKVLTMP